LQPFNHVVVARHGHEPASKVSAALLLRREVRVPFALLNPVQRKLPLHDVEGPVDAGLVEGLLAVPFPNLLGAVRLEDLEGAALVAVLAVEGTRQTGQAVVLLGIGAVLGAIASRTRASVECRRSR
jgi:hypothetical protein